MGCFPTQYNDVGRGDLRFAIADLRFSISNGASVPHMSLGRWKSQIDNRKSQIA